MRAIKPIRTIQSESSDGLIISKTAKRVPNMQSQQEVRANGESACELMTNFPLVRSKMD
jgi:hypothetical protein